MAAAKCSLQNVWLPCVWFHSCVGLLVVRRRRVSCIPIFMEEALTCLAGRVLRNASESA
jgi:hypothetical protein